MGHRARQAAEIHRDLMHVAQHALQKSLQVFYEPNLRLAKDYQLLGYNAGYAERVGSGTFDQHQKDLVWRLLGDVKIGPDSTVLDVGCGIGGPSSWMFERYQPKRQIGLEYCTRSVGVANENWAARSPRPIFINGDAQRIPLPDASVDVIFNLESALHYADKQQFIAECYRVLRPGGVLCLGDICTRYTLTFRILGLLNHIKTQFSTHARLWSGEDYKRAFAARGFRLLSHEEVSRQAADSLVDGLAEVDANGWKAAKGYRGRFFYLWFIEKLLRRGWLDYDLFRAVKP